LPTSLSSKSARPRCRSARRTTFLRDRAFCLSAERRMSVHSPPLDVAAPAPAPALAEAPPETGAGFGALLVAKSAELLPACGDRVCMVRGEWGEKRPDEEKE
jgi:hypothetical protein